MIAMLDATEVVPDAVRLRARSYELLRLSPGDAVADVGCGAGRAVAELAARGLRATGVDADEQILALAAHRWPAAGFRAGDACALPFADGELAGYRADKVYHEVADPARAVAEAHRVLAPGGRAVLTGQDWDVIVIDSTDPALTRTVVHARADLIRTPRAARGYRNLLLDAGFRDVECEVTTAVFTDGVMLPLLSNLAENARAAGAITAAQAENWIDDQRRRAADGRLFLALPIFTAAGRKP
ncbi:methyltransferase domain-containing protein [Nonomuraea sp. NN258]|nr:methyltransferase domain-containing protein [Nonomuraea antri]